MDLDEFNGHPREERDAILTWLEAHDLHEVIEFEIRRGKIRAHVFKTDENGKKYLVHKDGTRHVPSPGRSDRECGDRPHYPAEEWVAVPLQSPYPVAT